MLRASLDSPQVALDLRIPGFSRYTKALEQELSRALDGAASVKEALDKVAADWELITDQIGRDQQLALYRASMGLPPAPNRPRPRAIADQRKVTIGFSQATTTEPWRLLFNKELREEATHHPQVELVVKDAMDKAEQQIADLEALIAQPVDAILVSPKVTEELTPVISKAFNADIPVFVLDRAVANDRYTQFIGATTSRSAAPSAVTRSRYSAGPGKRAAKSWKSGAAWGPRRRTTATTDFTKSSAKSRESRS